MRRTARRRSASAWRALLAAAAIVGLAVAFRAAPASDPAWQLSPDSAIRLQDQALIARIARALDAARTAGTDPAISNHHVRAATVLVHEGEEHVVVGGNTEYHLPEAIHGEVSLVNQVTARFGRDASRQVEFVAFYGQTCGNSRGCGDCRDYMRAATDTSRLLWVCGQARDHTIHVRRFADGLSAEHDFPDASADDLGLPEQDAARLLHAAQEARLGGVTLFTPAEQHVAAAALSSTGRIYRAAGADDGAFHYRFPVGGVLQQAATERDYYVRAVVVVGAEGRWPTVSYRDRQYGHEASSFGTTRGHPPTRLILNDGKGRWKSTTFEAALPHAFSTARFAPEAIQKFLEARQPATAR
jgi:cytidine deaminase